ncbi:MAG: helix-turn-helix transcriptional regulator [Candidatus Berkelbacteria bacterium]|nr:helix-turn-helix transcriptional regulator [Candidatus Berkelbacteria bacterium]MCR4307021.1 helix-turn-helix transcriptional regulator [Candidatus Berkelbacteria bacterium]
MDKAEFLKNFGQRVSKVRREKGMTQEELAEAIDVHRTYVGFIEQGKRNPLIFNVYKIAEVTGVPASELLREL